MAVPDYPWRERASCRGLPAEAWEAGNEENRTAVRVCARCPVRWPCWSEAVNLGDEGVIRGGVFMNLRNRRLPFPPVVACACGCGGRFVAERRRKYASQACAERMKRVRV